MVFAGSSGCRRQPSFRRPISHDQPEVERALETGASRRRLPTKNPSGVTSHLGLDDTQVRLLQHGRRKAAAVRIVLDRECCSARVERLSHRQSFERPESLHAWSSTRVSAKNREPGSTGVSSYGMSLNDALDPAPHLLRGQRIDRVDEILKKLPQAEPVCGSRKFRVRSTSPGGSVC